MASLGHNELKGITGFIQSLQNLKKLNHSLTYLPLYLITTKYLSQIVPIKLNRYHIPCHIKTVTFCIFSLIIFPVNAALIMLMTNHLITFSGGNWPGTVSLWLVDSLTWKQCVGADGLCDTTELAEVRETCCTNLTMHQSHIPQCTIL